MDISPFKVIYGTDLVAIESPCDFLLGINTNLPPTLHRFQVVADQVIICQIFATDS